MRARRARLAAWTATIRGRLLVGVLAVMVVGLVGSAVATSALFERSVHRRDRQTLRDSAARVQRALDGGVRVVDGRQMEALLGAPLGVVVLDRQGRVQTSTGSALGASAALATAARAAPLLHVVHVGEPGAGDLLAVRVPARGLRVTLDPGRPALVADSVVLTIDTRIAGDAMRRVFRTQAVVIAGTLILLVLLMLVVLRIGLRPLTAMAESADAIAAGALRRRLPTSGGGAETDQLAATVNRALDAQSAAEDKVRAFAADASHELRTPLATISGWLDLYNQGGLSRPEDLERALGRVNGEVGRMRLLVEELSLLARLDAGRPLVQEPVDLVALAEGIVQDARVVSPERTITYVAMEDESVVVGDAPRLAQVLRNLVGNAVQHTPPAARVAVAVLRDGPEVVVTVTDDGPGIAPEHLPRVFERFWRAEGSRSRESGGSGLGLAIVRAIIQAHGGTVDAGAGPAGGTRMTVRLPAGDG